jgi:hypothetical protein
MQSDQLDPTPLNTVFEATARAFGFEAPGERTWEAYTRLPWRLRQALEAELVAAADRSRNANGAGKEVSPTTGAAP